MKIKIYYTNIRKTKAEGKIYKIIQYHKLNHFMTLLKQFQNENKDILGRDEIYLFIFILILIKTGCML